MKTEEQKIVMHPGIYRFKFPYIPGGYVARNEAGEVKVYDCDVEIRVGQEEDRKENRLVTIIMTSTGGPGVQSSIEHLATKIRLTFFDHIFHEHHYNKPIVPEDSIRWIEQHLFSKGSQAGNTSMDQSQEVTMKWDAKKHVYHSPSWKKTAIIYN